MSIIAWIILGLVAGLIAKMASGSSGSPGFIIIGALGVAGALLGGWAATRLFHVLTPQAFFNISTWLTATAGAAALLLAYHAILLLAYHLATKRSAPTHLRAAHR